MNRFVLATLVAMVAPLTAAQEGTVTYRVTTRIVVELPPELAHMADQLPSEQSASKTLVFDEAAALTSNAPRVAVDEPAPLPDPDEPRMVFRIGGHASDDQTHVDFETGVVTETRDFLGRMFRITGERPALAWRLTGERGQFLGYPCQRAVADRDSTTVEAWFTPAVPVPAGPGPYGGLPGLVLVLADGRRTYEATEVRLEPLGAPIEAPAGGREVTREAFDRIVKEKMEELEASRPRGERGGLIIRRQ